MKKILLIMILIFSTGKVSSQGYLNIVGLNITQISENQINANLKVYSPVFSIYNSYTTELNENIITLKVCYTVTIAQSESHLENDFTVDIPAVSGDYTLNVEVYAANPGVCTFETPYLQDSATLYFTNPFTGTISLSTIDTENLNKNITLYPNPVKDFLYFSEEVSHVKIIDLSGKVVKQFSTSGKSIDVSTISKGNYLITITTKRGQIISKKFIKN